MKNVFMHIPIPPTMQNLNMRVNSLYFIQHLPHITLLQDWLHAPRLLMGEGPAEIKNKNRNKKNENNSPPEQLRRWRSWTVQSPHLMSMSCPSDVNQQVPCSNPNETLCFPRSMMLARFSSFALLFCILRPPSSPVIDIMH